MQRAEDFLGGLADDDVVYCHWKSNSHLAAGLEGKTDLDLLVDGRDIDRLHRHLGDGGFKRFVTHPSRAYPGMEDFLGLHPDSGRLLHLHVQYRLLTGPPHLKNYRLPWEDLVLRTRTFDSESGVYTAEPGHEWLLLVVRSAMKIRGRDRLRAITGRGKVSEDLVAEHHWLATKVDRLVPVGIATDLLGDEVAAMVGSSIEANMGFTELVRLRRRLRSELAGNRAHGRVQASLLRARRELRWALGSLNRVTVHLPFPYARVPAGGGLVVAVIGGDGSGKSTITGRLHDWLAGKVDVIPIYFGSGKGRSSMLRRPLNLARRLDRRAKSARKAPERSVAPGGVGIRRAIWAMVLAREKRAKLRRAYRARERGFIVICDRFPQAQVAGMIDGPLLRPWSASGSRMKRAIARWEAKPYLLADDEGPDVVIRLDVPGGTAAARRPEQNAEMLDLRRGVVENLTFKNARFGLHSIDAEQELDTVLLDAKKVIWGCL